MSAFRRSVPLLVAKLKSFQMLARIPVPPLRSISATRDEFGTVATSKQSILPALRTDPRASRTCPSRARALRATPPGITGRLACLAGFPAVAFCSEVPRSSASGPFPDVSHRSSCSPTSCTRRTCRLDPQSESPSAFRTLGNATSSSLSPCFAPSLVVPVPDTSPSLSL